MKDYHIQDLVMREMERTALLRLMESEPDLSQVTINRMSPLMMAVELGFDDLIEPMIKQGCDINATFRDETALSIAINGNGRRTWFRPKNTENFVEILLRNGATVSDRDKDAYVSSLSRHSSEVLTLMLKNGFSIDRQRDGKNCLHYLMESGSKFNEDMKAKLDIVLSARPDLLYAHDRDGKTPISLLISNSSDNRLEMITYLMEKGVDMESRDSLGRTPLLNATRNYTEQRYEFIRHMIENGVNVNAVDNYGENVFLNMARSNGADANIISLLLERGADPNAKTNTGESVYDIGQRWFTNRLDDCLIKAMSNKEIKDIDLASVDYLGRTPFLVAISNYQADRYDLIEKMLDNGADVNAKNSKGNNALIIMSQCGNYDERIIGLLINNGIDPSLENNDGYTFTSYGDGRKIAKLIDDKMLEISESLDIAAAHQP